MGIRRREIFIFGAVLLAACVPFFAFAQAPEESMPTNYGIKESVQAAFPGLDVMVDIARCESNFRQYTDSGNALHGGAGGAMVGVFQINEPVHREYAQSRNIDIYTLEGNLAYAKHLYENEGTNPWISSFSCWGASIPDAAGASASDEGTTITSTLTLGVVSPQVLTLQKILNASGFTLASDGPGSPGQETTKFGSLTRSAVRKFQCAKIDVCSGDEYSTGYGLVGVRTRAALLANPASPVAVAPQSPAPRAEQDEAAEIARLQAMIVQLTAQIEVLKQQFAAR